MCQLCRLGQQQLAACVSILVRAGLQWDENVTFLEDTTVSTCDADGNSDRPAHGSVDLTLTVPTSAVPEEHGAVCAAAVPTSAVPEEHGAVCAAAAPISAVPEENDVGGAVCAAAVPTSAVPELAYSKLNLEGPALHRALIAASGRPDVADVKALLAAGAKPSFRDRYQMEWNALCRACWCGQVDNVRILLPVSEVNVEDALYRSPVFLAALGSHTEIVRLLLAAGADWRVGTNPLLAACAVGAYDSTLSLVSGLPLAMHDVFLWRVGPACVQLPKTYSTSAVTCP